MRALERAVGKKRAVIGQDTDPVAVDPRRAADQCFAPAGLEFAELAGVDHAQQNLAHVIGLFAVGADDAKQFRRIMRRRCRRRVGLHRARLAQLGHDIAHQRERVMFVLGQMVGNTRHARMHLGPAQRLAIDLFVDRNLDDRGSAQMDARIAAHHDDLV